MLNGFNHQSIAVTIEHRLCSTLGCERFGFGGIANSDEVRSNPYLCMVVGLMYNYQSRDIVTQSHIQKFIEDYGYYSKKSIDEIYTENEQDLENMINRFNELRG